MTYIRQKISTEVMDEIEHITGTLPGKVYYSDDGEALILADEGKYIISVEPPDVVLEGFNNGEPTTHSAYLFAEPPEVFAGRVLATPGWQSGWEC